MSVYTAYFDKITVTKLRRDSPPKRINLIRLVLVTFSAFKMCFFPLFCVISFYEMLEFIDTFNNFVDKEKVAID